MIVALCVTGSSCRAPSGFVMAWALSWFGLVGRATEMLFGVTWLAMSAASGGCVS